jgi:hypothetical protein
MNASLTFTIAHLVSFWSEVAEWVVAGWAMELPWARVPQERVAMKRTVAATATTVLRNLLTIIYLLILTQPKTAGAFYLTYRLSATYAARPPCRDLKSSRCPKTKLEKNQQFAIFVSV